MHYKEYLSQIGRKGGSVKSEKKAQSSRENAKKPRPNARGPRKLRCTKNISQNMLPSESASL